MHLALSSPSSVAVPAPLAGDSGVEMSVYPPPNPPPHPPPQQPPPPPVEHQMQIAPPEAPGKKFSNVNVQRACTSY